MNLLFRMLLLGVTSFKRGPLGLFDASELSFRVLPNDLDINGHMNNGRYLTLMDLGRTDLTMRAGLFSAMLKHRWMPVIAGVQIRFLRSLQPFQKYVLKSRVLGWDGPFFVMEQTFSSKGKVAAVALVRGVFLSGKTKVHAHDVFEASGLEDVPGESPAFPPHVQAWLESEAHAVQHAKGL